MAARARSPGRLPGPAERLHGSAAWAAPWHFGPTNAFSVRWVIERVRQRWALGVEVRPPADAVDAPALRFEASARCERLGSPPRLETSAAIAATVCWYDQVRAGRDARTMTLTQIEEQT